MDKLQKNAVDSYLKRNLPKILESNELIDSVSVLLTENDHDSIWDLLIIIPDEKYADFSGQYGFSYVFDDHGHSPPVFSKVRSIGWLKSDLDRRMPIALWVLNNSLIILDHDYQTQNLIDEYGSKFKTRIPDLIKLKYLELRSERHNLRKAVDFRRDMAIEIIRITVIKLALELSFLIDNQPYPYKKWLPEMAALSHYGREILDVSNIFLKAVNHNEIIETSQTLVNTVNDMLREKGALPNYVIERWWEYLT